MQAIQGILLAALTCQAVALFPPIATPSVPASTFLSLPTTTQPHPLPNQKCGGPGQECCEDSSCRGNFECLVPGDKHWVAATPRCVRPKVRGHCGTEGLSCCVGLCLANLVCAGGKMCLKPAAVIDESIVGSTTAEFKGWLKILVTAVGDMCFVKVLRSFETSVMTFGEGTFGDTFGDLSGTAECKDGAEGAALGYIRADALATATVNDEGDCETDGSSEIGFESTVKGKGIALTIGGDAGAVAGCGRRKLAASRVIQVA